MSSPGTRLWRRVLLASCLAAGGLAVAPPAFAAGETVTIYLTTTSDAGGRTVTRGLQQQSPVAFAAGSGNATHTINVNENARVQLYTCNGTGAQQWTYTSARDLVNTSSGKCLDVVDNAAADGARLQIWTCTGGANQKWNA
jgi:glucosylceramidase